MSSIHPPTPASRRSTLQLGAWMAAAAVLQACGGGNTQVAVVPGGGGTGENPPSPSPSPNPAPTPTPAPAPTPGFGTTGGNLPPAGGSFGVLSDVAKGTVARVDWSNLPKQDPADDPESEGLQPGMVLRINGGLDATPVVGNQTGRASELASAPELRGPVEAVSASGFTVLGVPVSVDSQTIFSGLALGEVRVGDLLQVHGLAVVQLRGTSTDAMPEVRLQATRVRRVRAQPELQIVLGAANRRHCAACTANQFLLNNTLHTPSSGPMPTEGQLVRVRFDGRQAGPIRVVRPLAPYMAQLLADATVALQGCFFSGADGKLRFNDLPVLSSAGLTLPALGQITRIQARHRDGLGLEVLGIG